MSDGICPFFQPVTRGGNHKTEVMKYSRHSDGEAFCFFVIDQKEVMEGRVVTQGLIKFSLMHIYFYLNNNNFIQTISGADTTKM